MAEEPKESYGWVIVIVLLVLAFGLIETPVKPSGFLRPIVGKWIGGLTEEARPTQPDIPTITKDEACALVYNYLENKSNAMTVLTLRMKFLDMLDEDRRYFSAVYQGKGKWQVSALGQWSLYETSRVIEPADDDAREWLHLILQNTR